MPNIASYLEERNRKKRRGGGQKKKSGGRVTLQSSKKPGAEGEKLNKCNESRVEQHDSLS